MKRSIAERRLLYSLKGSDVQKELVIRIGAPYLLEEGMVNFAFSEGTAGCSVEFDGLFENPSDIYGGDLLQALQLAANVEPTLEGLRKRYDFYFSDGSPYFDEDEQI